MKSRHFNSLMPYLNERWVSKVLGMTHNYSKGPDIFDNQKIIETKFTRTNNQRGNYHSWKVLEHQVLYPEKFNKIGFWGMGIYTYNTDISSLRREDLDYLESFVENRRLFIVPWKWIQKFKPHFTKGKSETSEWENIFRYPKEKMLPDISETLQVQGGSINFTEGVELEYFENILNQEFVTQNP